MELPKTVVNVINLVAITTFTGYNYRLLCMTTIVYW
jgi:hypothetical protein